MITGVRQSRRLAALAEAPSHSPSDALAAQQQGPPPQQQGVAPQQQERAPQQAEQLGTTQSAEVLQASILEASANVLKGLVRVHNDCTPCCSGFLGSLPKPSTYITLP